MDKIEEARERARRERELQGLSAGITDPAALAPLVRTLDNPRVIDGADSDNLQVVA